MKRIVHPALLAGALVSFILATAPSQAEPLSLFPDRYSPEVRATPGYLAPQVEPAYEAPRPARYVAQPQPEGNMGGGFIEFLFSNGPMAPRPPRDIMARGAPASVPADEITTDPRRVPVDPKFTRQIVPYSGPEKPGTIIIDTPHRFLFLVQGNGTAVRYGIGVGKPGFTWAGVKNVSAKKEWPDWVPPPEMLQRRPDQPTWMAGGPENPLGARAMYLGSSLYRIHGSNEPWTIGQAVSSGCIRMRNEDVIDLYERVKIGTRVVVI
jgi:lipoprotein-anchoring transpeptidase ErfK/SrfK